MLLLQFQEVFTTTGDFAGKNRSEQQQLQLRNLQESTTEGVLSITN